MLYTLLLRRPVHIYTQIQVQAAGVDEGRHEHVIGSENGLQRYGLEEIRRLSSGVGSTDGDKAGKHLKRKQLGINRVLL